MAGKGTSAFSIGDTSTQMVGFPASHSFVFRGAPALKLTYPLKIGLPNRKFHLPTPVFQVLCLFQGG